MKTHTYDVVVHWNAGDGGGTKNYRSYERDHTLSAKGRPPILSSSDVAFRGNASRYNPEELLVASLSSCHMLWYLHLCATNGVVVLDYHDNATGTMELNDAGSGRFTGVVLKPLVTVDSAAERTKAKALHERAHQLCFIAPSVNFPIIVQANVQVDALSPI
jgi:organic hydroperoxide reductase OsmC/OhrA